MTTVGQNPHTKQAAEFIPQYLNGRDTQQCTVYHDTLLTANFPPPAVLPGIARVRGGVAVCGPLQLPRAALVRAPRRRTLPRLRHLPQAARRAQGSLVRAGTASIGSVRPRITDFCHFGSVYRLTEDRKGHDDATAFSLTATFSITAALSPRTNSSGSLEHRVSGPSVEVTEVRIAAESSTEPNRTDPMEAVHRTLF